MAMRRRSHGDVKTCDRDATAGGSAVYIIKSLAGGGRCAGWDPARGEQKRRPFRAAFLVMSIR